MSKKFLKDDEEEGCQETEPKSEISRSMKIDIESEVSPFKYGEPSKMDHYRSQSTDISRNSGLGKEPLHKYKLPRVVTVKWSGVYYFNNDKYRIDDGNNKSQWRWVILILCWEGIKIIKA